MMQTRRSTESSSSTKIQKPGRAGPGGGASGGVVRAPLQNDDALSETDQVDPRTRASTGIHSLAPPRGDHNHPGDENPSQMEVSQVTRHGADSHKPTHLFIYKKNKRICVPLTTAKLSAAHQVYLPADVLNAAGAKEGQTFIVRVRHGIIELIPESQADRALETGLQNMRKASLARLGETWDNPEDDAWNEA
jgi:bifunctional DNA-binding transcriptional regulator/antitoxin component of YhaV-PrlF toxin-antitoxin module